MTASGLSAGYNGIPVFHDFDIEIKSGKILSLIGANGSGKSTVLKTMTRLLNPLQGSVCLEGKSIHAMPTKLAAQKLALLPQGVQVPQGITVRDLAEYGRFPYRSTLSGLSAKDKEIVEWALRSTDMEELAEREMDQLSGGQRQRGWIAMALAQKTGVLFLDEPTTYLDISHQLEILQLLRRLNRESGVTVVMILHDINYAVMFSDYIVAIKEGRKKYSGTPDEVVTPQMLHDIFNVDAAVIRHPALDVPVCLPYGVCEPKITNQEV
jgi:iron complex transport system ATP-binding protein